MRDVLVKIKLDLIDEATHPVRASWTDEEMKRQEISLKQNGLIEPLLIRPHPSKSGRYMLVDGHHRFASAKKNGWQDISCIVRDINDKDAYCQALIKNDSPAGCNMDALARGEAYAYAETFGLSLGDIATMCSYTTVKSHQTHIHIFNESVSVKKALKKYGFGGTQWKMVRALPNALKVAVLKKASEENLGQNAIGEIALALQETSDENEQIWLLKTPYASKAHDVARAIAREKAIVKKAGRKAVLPIGLNIDLLEEFVLQDAVEFISRRKENSVDLVLTDPPYNISRDTGYAGRVVDGEERFQVNMDFGEWDNMDQTELLSLLHSVFAGAYAALRPGGTIISFYDLWKVQELSTILENVGFRMLRFIEWVKTNPVPLNSKVSYLTGAREVAVVGVKGSKPIFNAEYHNGIYSMPIHRDGGKRLHPTQKPLALMEELIKVHSNEGDLVIDPFAGSATTLVAALQMGRRTAGCELNEQYFNSAKERLGA